MQYLYKQQDANLGTEYRRCGRIEIANPLDGVPRVYFIEQDVIMRENKDPLISNVNGEAVSCAMDNPNKTIPLLNPLTGEALGKSVSYGEVYAILWSAWQMKAVQRDAVRVAQLAYTKADNARVAMMAVFDAKVAADDKTAAIDEAIQAAWVVAKNTLDAATIAYTVG